MCDRIIFVYQVSISNSILQKFCIFIFGLCNLFCNLKRWALSCPTASCTLITIVKKYFNFYLFNTTVLVLVLPLCSKITMFSFQIIEDGCRTAHVALVAVGDKLKYILATENMKAGDIIKTSCKLPRIPGKYKEDHCLFYSHVTNMMLKILSVLQLCCKNRESANNVTISIDNFLIVRF